MTGPTIPGRLDRYLKGSSRRLIAYRAAMVLLVVLCALTAVVCWQGMNFRAADNGILTAMTFIGGIVAALAREIRRTTNETKSGTENQGGQS